MVSLGIATIISLLGRCKANDEQLAYIETRVECLYELRTQIATKHNDELKDFLRVFHGDSPATQLEQVNRKGALLHVEYMLTDVVKLPARIT